MHSQLFESLATGVTVVTASNRLARGLRARYNQHQVRRGLTSWPTPSIASFDQWCEQMWTELVDAGHAAADRLPNPAQVSALWERIVDESPEGSGLIQTHRTAAQARDAWELAAEWRIGIPDEHADDLNEDCRAFVRWASRYQLEATRRNWIDRARLAERIAGALAAHTIEAPKTMILAGFEELTPQQSMLVDVLRNAGTTVEMIEAHRQLGDVRAISLVDADDEIRNAAQWARMLLERDRGGSIGIVIPQLKSMRARVDAIFSDYLIPSSVLPDAARPQRPFNISSGKPLSDYPIIASALHALELCTGLVAIEKVGALLRSPFIGGGDDENASRALLDARLRRNGRTEVRASEIRARASEKVRTRSDDTTENVTHHSPRLVALLDQWDKVCAALPPRMRPSKWARAFAGMLNALGWPGDRTIDGDEHQALEKWWELLSTYSTLDGVIGDEAALGAVRRIVRMAGEVEFQPRTDDAPVQILGTLEAAGMSFEHLWVAGMHDEEMPATPKPNPFLPLRLQRTHRVARASAERELEFARVVVSNLLASAPHIIVSHPRAEGERPLVPSPLIAHLDPQPAHDEEWSRAQLFESIVFASGGASMRETFDDHAGPPVDAGAALRGGTRILQDQAACAFRAFANHRLGARPLERPSPGLDARERGTLIHRVLETFWKEITSHSALVELDESALGDVVDRHVDAAIARSRAEHPESFSDRFASIERRRLASIMRTWFEVERARAPFTVDIIEEGQPVAIGPITLNVRIDRMDTLDDGRKVLIDYKTSRPSPAKWFGDRPDEPQLPIYSTTCNEIAAVLYVQLKADEVRFKGIAADTGIIPSVKEFKGRSKDGIETWEEINERWRQVLTALGEQFMRGDAAVAPKSATMTCLYCEVGPLCRVRDAGDDAGEAEATEYD